MPLRARCCLACRDGVHDSLPFHGRRRLGMPGIRTNQVRSRGAARGDGRWVSLNKQWQQLRHRLRRSKKWPESSSLSITRTRRRCCSGNLLCSLGRQSERPAGSRVVESGLIRPASCASHNLQIDTMESQGVQCHQSVLHW